MKKWWVVLLAILMLLSYPSPSMASEDISVILDGKKLDFDVAPLLENDRVLVPLRTIFEKYGAVLEWNGKFNKTSAQVRGANGAYISVQVGKDIAYKNDKPFKLEIAPQMIEGRTFVPVRFIAKVLDAKVSWDEESKTVFIKDSKFDYERVMSYLKDEDLTAARNIAIKSYPKSNYPYMGRNADLSIGFTYYFPEGEAARFYKEEGSKISFVEAIDGVFRVTWQARIGNYETESDRLLENQDTISNYKNNYYKKAAVIEEYGTQPIINQPLFFFHYMPTVDFVEYGKITNDGTRAGIGGKDSPKKKYIAAVPGEEVIK